jgi:hypothetical protein
LPVTLPSQSVTMFFSMLQGVLLELDTIRVRQKNWTTSKAKETKMTIKSRQLNATKFHLGLLTAPAMGRFRLGRT